MEPNQPKPQSVITIPVAIIVAGAIIAGAVIWTKKPVPAAVTAQQIPSQIQEVRAVTSDDHILGNPNAKIKIVEYSDASCPFCKIFHATMLQVMTEYGKTGNVAWVYRHFPLDQADENGNILHKNAGTEAQAMECAADLGGNDKFWAYANRLYSITPSVTNATPEGLNPAQLPEIAVYAGLDKTEFKTCLSSGKNKAEVDADYLEGINAGVSGTPYSVIITANGKQIPVNGAQSYATLKNALDGLLGQ